ncbi:MAG: hypothetical protein RJA87_649 [Pseudomonadota bacterium]|jgi:hypothetical protein
MVEMLAFPPSRRVGLIRKHGRIAAQLNSSAATSHLRYQVEIQRRALMSKGVARAVVDRECAALLAALYAEMFRQGAMPEVG